MIDDYRHNNSSQLINWVRIQSNFLATRIVVLTASLEASEPLLSSW